MLKYSLLWDVPCSLLACMYTASTPPPRWNPPAFSDFLCTVAFGKSFTQAVFCLGSCVAFSLISATPRAHTAVTQFGGHCGRFWLQLTAVSSQIGQHVSSMEACFSCLFFFFVVAVVVGVHGHHISSLGGILSFQENVTRASIQKVVSSA